mmetsp:Transcript_7554/g.17290  ORF Transcript_7554/g.17290 Transcript_7554/m.17290 type:complete len:235 (-) Transcript_7554:149-853(-)
MNRVTHSSRNDFCELLHVRRLDVHNVECRVVATQVPQVDPKIICREEIFLVAVERDRVDMIGMSIHEHAFRRGTYHILLSALAKRWDIQAPPCTVPIRNSGLRNFPVLYSPQFDSFVVGRNQEKGIVDAFAPTDAVNFLLDLQTLEIVEFSLVALKLRPQLVFRRTRTNRTSRCTFHLGGGTGGGPLSPIDLLVDAHTTPPVTGCQEVASLIEFAGGQDISVHQILKFLFVESL